MSSHDDPRDPSLETRLTLPKTWQTGGPDSLSAASMLVAGAVMVTRNRFLGWPALLLGINAFINQHPLRSKESGTSWNGLFTGVAALILAYLPMTMITANPALQVPRTNT